MNVVLYVNSFLPTIGGRELVVYHLACALMDLDHQVRVVGPGGVWRHRKLKFRYPVHRHSNIVRYQWRKLLHGGSLAQEVPWHVGFRWGLYEGIFLSQLIMNTVRWGCDVIHAHNTYPTGYIASRLERFKKLPLVITPHGADIHMIPKIGFGLRLNPLLATKIRFALQKATTVTAISSSVEKSLLEAGAPLDKIRRVPNGVDIERFERPIGRDVRAWLGVEIDSRLICTVGNYHPRKGHEVLIRTMPLILKNEPRARLVIVGRYPETLTTLVRDLGLREKVLMTGSLTFPDMPHSQTVMDNQTADQPDWLAGLYQCSEVYVSPSIDEKAEGLSLALLEAMGARLPVVATDISGSRDIIQNSVSGLLVPPSQPSKLAEAILLLLGNEEIRSRLGANARNAVGTYHWRETARQYVTIYEEAREMLKRTHSV
jgi:Glycosyltransferase